MTPSTQATIRSRAKVLVTALPTSSSTPPVLTPNGRKPAVLFIFFTLFLDVLGFAIIIPISPSLIQQFENGRVDAAAHDVGLLMSLYALMQFFFAPILGSLSDTFGRRPVILFSLLGSALDYVACGFANTLIILYITRAINGITGANFAAANAYVADVTPPEKRAASFGMLGAAFGLAFSIGPFLGGWLGTYSLRLPFFVAAGLCAANFIYGCFVLPESLNREHRRPFTWSHANPLTAFATLKSYPMVANLAISFFLLYVGQTSLRATWVLYTGDRYNWTPLFVGLSLTAVGLSYAFVQGFLSRKIVPRLGEKRAVTMAFITVVLADVAYGLASEGWMIYVIIAVSAIGAVGFPALQSIISRGVSPREQGTIQGALTAIQSLAQIVGPAIGTTIFAYFISDHVATKIPGMAFFASAFLELLALLNIIRVLKQHHAHFDPRPQQAAA